MLFRSERLELDKDEITRQKEEFEEENTGDEGLLEELKNDKGNITKTNLKNGIKETKKDPDLKEELKILEDYLDIVENEGKANKKIRDAKKKLDEKVAKKYGELSIEEIKAIVIDDKWMTSIVDEVSGELERISHRLTSRIKELVERYEETLPQIEDEVEEYEDKVKAHLERMGFKW